jgi:hypothetical protein
LLSSVLASGCEEDYFDYFLYYGYSKSGKKGTTESIGMNLVFKPPELPWLTASLSTSYVWNTWEDNVSGTDLIYQNRGIADASVSGSIDFTELLDPRSDELDLRPHFLLSVGTTLPTGSENASYAQGRERIPAAYQLGLGEAVPFVSLSYFQNFGDGTFSTIASITDTARMEENSAGYQKPSSLSWLAGAQYSLTETWSTAVFAAIGGSHTFSPERDRMQILDPFLGLISVPFDVPDAKADTITWNIGCTFKPWDEKRWAVGVSFVFPGHTSIKDDSLAMKWAGALGVCYSF